MNYKGFGEELIGTDTWFSKLFGRFSQSDIEVESIGEIRLHTEIASSVREFWLDTLRLRRETVLSEAEKDGKLIEVFVRDEDSLPALYVKEGNVERRTLFSGPSVALVGHERIGGKLKVVHGLTNYAVRTFMNTRPYAIIERYGYRNFVDSVNVSVLPTFVDESGEVGQTFRRHRTNVNEYPGAVGTIAGGFASRNPKIDLSKMSPFWAIQKEMYEEGRLLPFLDIREYTERGIIPPDSEVGFDELTDGSRIAYVMRSGQPRVRALLYDDANLVCTGIITDIHPFAKDPTGAVKQFLKSEYVFLCRTGIPRKHYDEKDGQDIQKGWPVNDEHVDAYYFPFTVEGISQYVTGNHPELMGPTSAVITHSLMTFERGGERIMDLVRDVGKHPLYNRVPSHIPFASIRM